MKNFSSYRARKVKKIIDVKGEKKFSAFIKHVRELVISNMHNKFGKDTWKTFQGIAPTSKC